MFTINAVDARRLQKEGISPLEHMENAIRRCQDAVIDVSRRGASSIEVAVFQLLDDQFEYLQNVIKEAGFAVMDPHRVNSTSCVLVISWANSES